MANAKLTAIEIERFKSYARRTRVELTPLTVLLGRNNSGKSTLIQALLLLKQTLALPRPEVPLHLEGMVDALSLRELTSGWPEGSEIQGPSFSLEWTSTVDVDAALEQAHWPDVAEITSNTYLSWLNDRNRPRFRPVTTRLELDYAELSGKTILKSIKVSSLQEMLEPSFNFYRRDSGTYSCFWKNTAWGSHQPAGKLSVELDHFLPYLLIERRKVGPRDRQRSWYNAFLVLFAQPLEDLKTLLTSFSYLGSMRTLPPSLYRPATVPPEDIGVSGEYAAQMLHARRADVVHYLRPLQLRDDQVILPDTIQQSTLVDGVNEVLQDLGVDASLSLEDVKDVGFRLLFGRANLQHVGRGISYLLPVIQTGLISDPLRFMPTDSLSLDEYREACPSYGHCAFEEPEVHLHPKVQTRLAHWLVALAMSRRQLFIETHSDHLVRRLRGLVARANAGSELENWLLQNVKVLHVEQRGGESSIEVARLTSHGGLETWPSDFMDAASGEERLIYHASLDKPEQAEEAAVKPQEGLPVEHDVGEEPEP
jgi:predicted ATPase